MKQNKYILMYLIGREKWQKIKESGITFAIPKVTRGNDYQDPTFLMNWFGMINSHIKLVAYNYLKRYQSAESQIINIKESLNSKMWF